MILYSFVIYNESHIYERHDTGYYLQSNRQYDSNANYQMGWTVLDLLQLLQLCKCVQSEDSLKATNIQRDNRVSLCADDQTPQFSFVTIHATTKLVRQKYNELLKWNTKIAERIYG
jgi:hypothetical protein